MADTHADLAPSPPRSDSGSKTGAFLMVLSIFFGLICFVLCLLAEVTRTQVTWSDQQCVYSGSGRLPLLCGAGAIFALAIAMVVEHTFMLIAIKRLTYSPVTWDPDSDFEKSIPTQAAFFFVATWVSFAVGEILLLIGLSIESGHLKGWASPRSGCLALKEGIFTAAGVFGLVTVFLAGSLYVTVLRAQQMVDDQREVLEVSSTAILTTPSRSPPLTAIRSENTAVVSRQDRSQHTLADYMTEFERVVS